ncbi:MAG: hypothetical protein ACRDBG_19025 [Waterburya sp.]
MKLLNLTIASVLSANVLALPASAQYGDAWSPDRLSTAFEYGTAIGKVYVDRVDLKTGLLDNGVAHTEFLVDFTTADCGENYFPRTVLTLKASNSSGEWVSNSRTFETYESTTYFDELISVEGYYLSHLEGANLNVKTSTECVLWNSAGEFLDQADPSNIDPTDDKCSSNWLDYDCWGV